MTARGARKQQAGLQQRFAGPPRQVTVRSWRDDLAELADEVRAFAAELREHSDLCILVGAVSFGAGLAVTVGLAKLWSLFL